MFDSLRLRMALSHAAVLVVLLGSVGGVGYFVLARSVDRSLTNSVLASARAEVDLLQENQLSPPPDSDIPSASATRIAVYAPNGKLFGESADVPPWLRPRGQRITTITAGNERVRMVTLSARKAHELLATVVAARSLGPQEELLSHTRWLLLWGGLIAAGLSFVAGWFLAGAAAKPVRRAYESQERFAADASHELRTPLAFLRSGSELVEEHDPELSGDMIREIDYLTALTSRLLALARAQSDREPATLEPVSVEDVCRDAIARAHRGLDVQVALEADGHPVARADRIMLEAAIDAILENVAVYGGGAATLSCTQHDGHVSVSIADRGPGIPRELRQRVLEPFFRADPARGRDHGGAGLGLALASSLIDTQGGTLHLVDSEGGGLTVAIELPAAGP